MTKPTSKSDSKPLIVTAGEPAGVGPDLILELAARAHHAPWVVAADVGMLEARAKALGLRVQLNQDLDQPATSAGTLTVAHVPLAAPVVPGVLDTRNAAGVLASLDLAIDGVLSGAFSGMVTGPVQKSVINDAGTAFSGHTEYLQAASGADDVVMLLVAGGLRVALATTHLPLRAVADAITAPLLERRLRILHADLCRRFAISQPCIVVCGLNPHAGEGGHLGSEEQAVFEPVLSRLRGEGMNLRGPLPADTAFTPRQLEGADAVLAAYHDQGLPVLKALGFGTAVNVTLGLPFVRTSVDHGTALDLAGRGGADTGSFAAALTLAEALA